YWYPYDEIEVELEIKNKGNWDIDNIEVEWILYTTDGKEIMDNTLNDFNLKDGKDEIVTFTFKLDENIDDFEGENAVLYIRAKGTIDDNDAGVYDGEDTCDSEKTNVDVYADDDFVILTDFKINGVELNEISFDEYGFNCGQEITITAEAWNIGSDDQEEVSMRIYNNVLGINEMIELGDIDAYENKEFSFNLDIPKESEEKWYSLEFRIFDEDNDMFENSQDDEAIFNIFFEVEGSCGLLEPTMSAELLTEAKENQEMTIKVTIKNVGSKDAAYRLNAAGFGDWAELIEISERDISVDAGKSKDVLFKFKTKKDSAGERFFDIEVYSDNKMIAKQPVVVSIEEVKNNNVKEFIQNNWKLLLIGLVNLILIIAIIIVAIRTYRR
ncbi:MAG: putative S-layer protein, partial [archaeon]